MVQYHNRQNLIIFVFFFVSILISSHGIAQNKYSSALCSTIYRSANYGCDDSSSSNSPGASYPLLFDAFNLSASNLPTYHAPLGIEAYSAGDDWNFALIKGYEGFGLGAAVKNSDVTFFSNFENHKLLLKSLNGYNDQLLSPYMLFGGGVEGIKIPNIFNLPLGLSLKVGEDAVSWIPGISIKGSFFSLAASYYQEKPTPYSDGYYEVNESRKFLAVVAGMRLWNFMFDYSFHQMHYEGQYKLIPGWYSTGTNETFIADYTLDTHIFSTTFGSKNFQLTYAYRLQEAYKLRETERYLLNMAPEHEIQKKHQLYGLRYQPWDKFAIGVYYNYVLDEAFRFVGQLYF